MLRAKRNKTTTRNIRRGYHEVSEGILAEYSLRGIMVDIPTLETLAGAVARDGSSQFCPDRNPSTNEV
jgi:hypothetical protein